LEWKGRRTGGLGSKQRISGLEVPHASQVITWQACSMTWMDSAAVTAKIVGERMIRVTQNVAEAIEGEVETQEREERVARDRDQEATMVKNMDWEPMDLVDQNEENMLETVEVNVIVVPEDSDELVIKPSDLIKLNKPTLSTCVKPEHPPPPPCVDHDTVLRHMSLCPDLDMVQPTQEEEWGVIPWPGMDPDTQFSFDPSQTWPTTLALLLL